MTYKAIIDAASYSIEIHRKSDNPANKRSKSEAMRRNEEFERERRDEKRRYEELSSQKVRVAINVRLNDNYVESLIDLFEGGAR